MRTSHPVTVTKDMRLYDYEENMTYDFDAYPIDKWTKV